MLLNEGFKDLEIKQLSDGKLYEKLTTTLLPPLRDPVILITWMSLSSVHHHFWISSARPFHILMCFWGPWWLVQDRFAIKKEGQHVFNELWSLPAAFSKEDIFVLKTVSRRNSLLSVSWPCKGLQCYLGVSGVGKTSISENWRNTLTPISIRDRWWY